MKGLDEKFTITVRFAFKVYEQFQRIMFKKCSYFQILTVADTSTLMKIPQARDSEAFGSSADLPLDKSKGFQEE